MKAVLKPIEVIEFDPEASLPATVRLQSSGCAFFVWSDRRNDWAELKPGDYIDITDPRDVHPIARDVFEATYELIGK